MGHHTRRGLEPDVNNNILNPEKTDLLISDLKRLLDKNNISIEFSGDKLFMIGSEINTAVDE